MTTALVVESSSINRAQLVAELQAAGVHVLGAPDSDNLVRETARLNPDVVICRETSADAALLSALGQITSTAPCAIILFVDDPDADRMAQAFDAGISAYVVSGYDAKRLRSIIHVASARFRRDMTLRAQLSELEKRFEERKLVDRAKGILMRARQLSEEDAFRALRTASMHSKRRVGQVAQQVIEAARYAEAVNRAGQLRMLSQRLVKLYALRLQDIEPLQSGKLMAESISRMDSTIEELPRRISKSTFGDLIEAVIAAWIELKACVLKTPAASRLPEVDQLAEHLLKQAEQLTANLESGGLVKTLSVINIAGRQRMLSQRLAKLALIGWMVAGPAAQSARAEQFEVAETFEKAMLYLGSLPLSTRDIRELLSSAEAAWADLSAACRQGRSVESQWTIGLASETLLVVSEKLTDEYERSMQVLMG